MPESKNLEIFEEKDLYNALKDQKKVGKSSVEEIKEVIRLVMLKIGLRSQNIPNQTELAVIVIHIVESYPNHTLEEIKLAFNMAIAGKLDVEVNCYENFSCLYISNIINAYRLWAREAVKHLPKKPLKQIEEKKTITDEEMEEWVEDWKIKIKEIENPIMIPPNFYDWLCKKEILILTNEQKRDYITNQAVVVRHHFLTLLSKADGEHAQSTQDLIRFNEMRILGVFEGIEVERLKELAKKIAVFDYLKANIQK